MGCWNAGCAISNLPILAEEKVKLIFLQGKFDVVGTSDFGDPTTHMSPAFFSIDAECNDYGGIEDAELSWNTTIVLRYLKNRYSGPEDSILVDGEKISDWTLEDFVTKIERGNWEKHEIPELPINYPKQSKYPLSFVLVRKDVWDGIIDYQKAANVNYYSPYNEVAGYKEQIFEDYLSAEFNGMIQAKIIYEEKLKIFNETGDRKDFVLFDWPKSPFSRDSSKGDGDHMLVHDKYLELYLNAKNENNISLAEDIFNTWLEFKCIEEFMTITRRAWIFTSGAGRQHTNWEAYKALSNTILEIVNFKMNEELDAWEDE